jgi:hypothetical protein
MAMSVVLALMAVQVAGAAPAATAPVPASAPVAQGETAGPPAPPKPRPKLPASLTPSGCSTSLPTEPGVITVCAPPPEGYRIDPDVIRAKKIARDHTLPKGREALRDTSCATVGPMGCRGGGGISVVGAVLTAANMITTAVEGGNVAKLLVTDPQPSEYEIYLAAKADREVAEREKAAQAAALAVTARHGRVAP